MTMHRVIPVMLPRLTIILFGIVGVLCACERAGAVDIRTEFENSLTSLPEAKSLNVRGTVYVPVYSRVQAAGTNALIDVSTTLRIDNTSESKPIVINLIDYFSTGGTLVQKY